LVAKVEHKAVDRRSRRLALQLAMTTNLSTPRALVIIVEPVWGDGIEAIVSRALP
jgi:hypothetical protein